MPPREPAPDVGNARYTGPERRRAPRWRSRPLRLLFSLLVLVAIGYVAVVIWLMTQETRLVFQAGATLGSARPAFAYEQVDLPRPDGARQFAWRMPGEHGEGSPWVLFLHGNAATIASSVNISHYRMLRSVGLNVFAPEYPRLFRARRAAHRGGARDRCARRLRLPPRRRHPRRPDHRLRMVAWIGGRGPTLCRGAGSGRDSRRGAGVAGRHRPAAVPVLSHSPGHAQQVRVVPENRPDPGADPVPAQPGRRGHSDRGGAKACTTPLQVRSRSSRCAAGTSTPAKSTRRASPRSSRRFCGKARCRFPLRRAAEPPRRRRELKLPRYGSFAPAAELKLRATDQLSPHRRRGA